MLGPTGIIAHRPQRRTGSVADRLAPDGTWRGLLKHLAATALRLIVVEGWGTFFCRLVRVRHWERLLRDERFRAAARGSLNEQYRNWVRRRAPTKQRLRSMRGLAAGFQYRPKISIVTPLLGVEPAVDTRAVDSVRAQVYDRWELCVVTSNRTPLQFQEMLASWGREDPRIKVVRAEGESDLAAMKNAALELSTGDFVGLVDELDELKPNGLFEVVKLLQQRRDLDIIYTDEDQRSLDGRLVDPFFKPDWSSDLLLSINYVGRLSVFRRELVNRVGGFRYGLDGSEDYDLILRATELSDRVGHAAEPVYTRRKSGTAMRSLDRWAPPVQTAKSAISDALVRRGAAGDVEVGLIRGSSRVRYRLKREPSVSVIIPICDRVELLRRCVASIQQKSSYRNYEVVVVDNCSREPETLEYLASLGASVLRYSHEFNFSKIVNFAVSQIRTDFALFLNNDTEVIAPDWIEAMLEHGQRREVAAVGARLLYPDGKPQHEGVVVGVGGGFAANAACGHYFGLGQIIRNVSAVTAACMLTRTELFRELGGFEERLRVAFSDVDFCLRAREKGYVIVYTPYALLCHHEGATRGKMHPLDDDRFFREKWGGYHDPYYSPMLDPNCLYQVKL